MMATTGTLPGANRMLREMLALLTLTGVLWALHYLGRTLPTAVLAAAWLAIAAALCGALFVSARTRRAAFLAVYLRAASPLTQRLRGGVIMAIRVGALAATLALVLVIAILRLEQAGVWVTLIASAVLLPLTRALTAHWLAAHASPTYLPELSRRFTLASLGFAMTLVLITLAYHRAHPDFGGVSLESAVWHLAEREDARSEPARWLLELAAAKDALRLWLARQLMPAPGESFAQGLFWLVILAEEALFVWSYLLLCSAVLIGRKSDDSIRPQPQ